MSGRSGIGVWPRSAMLGLLAGLLMLPVDAAEPLSQDAFIRARIAAGEFAPAVAMARRAADPRQRDAWLAQIAVAQAQAGARGASIRSAAQIHDDRTRTQAISRIGSHLLGERGGTGADFDELIDLITSTIAPTTWDEVGGSGSIAPFEGGVYVDPAGLLLPLMRQDASRRLAALRAASAARFHRGNARRSSPLRKVSLPRLEKHVELLLAAGRPPTETMRLLAGLQRIQYIFVYPETGDLVLAGPAGDWRTDAEGRIVGTDSGLPVLRLDDLIVVFRRMMSEPDGGFGCSITPRQDALARTRAFLDESNKTPIAARSREAWLEQLRSRLGRQDIEVRGLDPHTRVARVMVAADYRMKLVGMGLEEGVPGVESYLDSIEVREGETPPPLDVLRWWFTLDYQAVLVASDHHALEIRGQGVQVLSENELLTSRGKRVHTGRSEALNRQFAQSFAANFAALSAKYPIYAELRNIFDLALVGALVQRQGLDEKTSWHMTCFGDPDAYQVEIGPAPAEVETVVNHRVVNRVHILAGVSGGVRVDPAPLVARNAIEIETTGVLDRRRSAAAAEDPTLDVWWWD